jgi:hypothetical protein
MRMLITTVAAMASGMMGAILTLVVSRFFEDTGLDDYLVLLPMAAVALITAVVGGVLAWRYIPAR